MTNIERVAQIEQLMRPFKVSHLYEHNEEDLDTEDLARLHSNLELVKKRLDSYSDQLLSSLHQTILHGDEKFSSELVALIESTRNSAIDVHEHFTFRQHLSPDTDLGTVRSILRGLHHYPELPQSEDHLSENYAEAPAAVQEQVIALIKVVEALDYELVINPTRTSTIRREQGRTMVTGHELIEVILSHPADAERISRIIIERQAQDAALIASLLDSSAPSLSEGII